MKLTEDTFDCQQLAIVGRGRLGAAIARALTADGSVSAPPEPFGRGFDGLRDDGRPYLAVLLCVTDAEIANAASAIVPGPIVGHCSGATGLEALGSHRAFSLHPLMTVTGDGADFSGAGAAIDGSGDETLAYAQALAAAMGLEPFRVLPQDRAAYHAAASIASGFMVTIEEAAERLAATAGVDRHLLFPLVRATVENWAAAGARRALTGPVARGDLATVARQREAVTERMPGLLPLFDALINATAELAA